MRSNLLITTEIKHECNEMLCPYGCNNEIVKCLSCNNCTYKLLSNAEINLIRETENSKKFIIDFLDKEPKRENIEQYLQNDKSDYRITKGNQIFRYSNSKEKDKLLKQFYENRYKIKKSKENNNVIKKVLSEEEKVMLEYEIYIEEQVEYKKIIPPKKEHNESKALIKRLLRK